MIAVVDIETTGLDYWRSEVITLSIGLYSNELIAEKEFNFKPVRTKFWSTESEKIHGISLEQSLTFKDGNESWMEFFEFCEEYIKKPIPFVCHAKWFGHYFDRAFIECQLFLTGTHWFLRKYFSETISTMTMCQTLRSSGVYQFEKLSLDYLADYFKFDLDHHNAKSDRQVCAKIYYRVLEEYESVYKEKLRAEAIRETNKDQEASTPRTVRSTSHRKKSRKSTKMVR